MYALYVNMSAYASSFQEITIPQFLLGPLNLNPTSMYRVCQSHSSHIWSLPGNWPVASSYFLYCWPLDEGPSICPKQDHPGIPRSPQKPKQRTIRAHSDLNIKVSIHFQGCFNHAIYKYKLSKPGRTLSQSQKRLDKIEEHSLLTKIRRNVNTCLTLWYKVYKSKYPNKTWRETILTKTIN